MPTMGGRAPPEKPACPKANNRFENRSFPSNSAKGSGWDAFKPASSQSDGRSQRGEQPTSLVYARGVLHHREKEDPKRPDMGCDRYQARLGDVGDGQADF